MLIFVKVRVATPSNWMSQWFVVDTNELPPLDQHALEMLVEAGGLTAEKFRNWRDRFRAHDEHVPIARPTGYSGGLHCIAIEDYCEDGDGNGLTIENGIRIVMQNEDLVILPSGTRAHDVALAFTDNSPIPEDPLSYFQFTQSEVNGLALFLRDIKELRQSPFYQRHSTMHSFGSQLRLETISVDLIRSFIVVFRRLYMTGKHDVGNFRDSCDVYCARFWNKRLIDWVAEERRLYDEFLHGPAAEFPGTQPVYSFSNKRLIDVFLYTRFAHHPDETRTRQLRQMRVEVGSEDLLEFMFYTAVQHAAMIYCNVSQYIAFEMDGYWKVGGLHPTADVTPFCNGADRGVLLTAEEEVRDRLMKRAAKLGEELWKNAGSPSNELPQFVQDAIQHLSNP